ncbi:MULTISPECIES: hypothetical protein [unclassified Rhodococcus (in: high G+C Gram-positive bacteria)]|uniref:hypothetical protein n=1 Tax=unclassified Rhodococcus (in: high G+C Gram-positive bacteria) TaxID=192944 RepID=UPI000B9BBAB6|nr:MULTISPECIES: hypothetical protein [unclassified Rhodococcus (in: high G+C Gram-positive bacteria)]OZE35656.1 hypothetical protein CH259_16665 [Rhodococcus sp. 05-2254-4]OZE48085.1 hypothetical protein CH261_09260 [Rhodococcus sp. 05-2254-3]OZE49296.1 hypothetical protein CH283_17045 [Rhodococcus sp. 05-2254-2]
MSDFLEVDRGVITAVPRHLRLVSSTTGPTYTEADEDPYEVEEVDAAFPKDDRLDPWSKFVIWGCLVLLCWAIHYVWTGGTL